LGNKVDFSGICGKFVIMMGFLCLTLEEFLQPAAERVFYCGINYGPLLFCSRPFSSVVRASDS
ncbi:TPA: hypothetical protein ACF29F_005125, partial [Escherichia coli]